MKLKSPITNQCCICNADYQVSKINQLTCGKPKCVIEHRNDKRRGLQAQIELKDILIEALKRDNRELRTKIEQLQFEIQRLHSANLEEIFASFHKE